MSPCSSPGCPAMEAGSMGRIRNRLQGGRTRLCCTRRAGVCTCERKPLLVMWGLYCTKAYDIVIPESECIYKN